MPINWPHATTSPAINDEPDHMAIAVIGSINTDLIIQVPRFAQTKSEIPWLIAVRVLSADLFFRQRRWFHQRDSNQTGQQDHGIHSEEAGKPAKCVRNHTTQHRTYHRQR